VKEKWKEATTDAVATNVRYRAGQEQDRTKPHPRIVLANRALSRTLDLWKEGNGGVRPYHLADGRTGVRRLTGN
jgi:hypothetical protein